VSGLLTVVFVDKSSLKMAVPLSNYTVLEQRAVIRCFMVSRRKNSNLQENFNKGILSKWVLLRDDTSRPNSVVTVVEATRPLKFELLSLSYTHTHTHTHTHANTHKYMHPHARTHTKTHSHTHVHAHTHTHLHVHARTHSFTHAHTHVHARAHIHTLSQIHTHTTHTHTHTCAHARARAHTHTHTHTLVHTCSPNIATWDYHVFRPLKRLAWTKICQ
jgi:hypothetical protein